MPQLFEAPRPAGRRWVWTVVLLLLLLHTAEIWGSISTFRGDMGRWLHEVSRYAAGETLYRDFTWAFPPLAMWVLGSVARVLGSDVAVLWTCTTLIAAGIFLCYERYAAQVAPRELHLLTVVSGFLLATAFAAWRASPLPLGMYAPPLTLGFLTFLAAMLSLLAWLREARALAGVGVGMFAGLSALAKQEYWIPAACIVGGACLVVVLERRARAPAQIALLLAPFAIVLSAGAGAVLLQSDWAGLMSAISGPNAEASRLTPSTAQSVLEGMGACMLGLLLSPFLIRFSERRRNWVAVGMVAGSALGLAILAGVLGLFLRADWAGLMGAITGFGHIGEFGSRSMPTGMQLVGEVAALSVAGMVVTGCLLAGRGIGLRQAVRWGGAALALLAAAFGYQLLVAFDIAQEIRAHGIGPQATYTQEFLAGHVGTNVAVVKRSLVQLRDLTLNHALPLLLPLFLAGLLLVRWKQARRPEARNLALLLLLLCIGCRSRRVFSQVDWLHFLMEIPVYLLVATVLLDWERSRRGVTLAMIAMSAFGGYFYLRTVTMSRYAVLVPVETVRGTVRLYPEDAQVYQQLQGMLRRIDPGGQRPLFAIGSSGGYNYFLDRRNPTPYSQGFLFTRFPAEPVIERMLKVERPILVYHEAFLGMKTPLGKLTRYGWEAEVGPIHFARVDESYFGRLRAACQAAGQTEGSDLIFYVYDCGP